MKCSIRFVKKEGKVWIQLIDLKYKNKVAAEKELSRLDCCWIIQELAPHIH